MIVSTINLFPETRKTAFGHFHHVVLNLRGKKMSSVYITQETGGRLTSGVEKFNNSFLPEDGSRGVL